MTTLTENAIQEDATAQLENETSGENEANAPVYTPSARELAMDAIAEQRKQSLSDDGVVIAEDEPKVKARPADEQLAEQMGQDDKATTAAQSTMVRVKVDGEEIEMPLSEVVKSYQKDQTASRRLTEATRLLAFAEEKASKFAQFENNVNNSEEPDGKAPDAERKQRQEHIREAFKKLYEGDEDGAVEAMEKFSEMQGAKRAAQAPEVDPQAIAAQVRQQLDVESAYSETRLDYPELFSDTERGVVLGKATMERIDAKKSQGISGGQALRESAEEVAAMFGVKKTGRQQTRESSTARDTKLDRKANLDSLDSANVVAGGKTAPAENQDVHSAIAEMARGRLGQSLGGAG